MTLSNVIYKATFEIPSTFETPFPDPVNGYGVLTQYSCLPKIVKLFHRHSIQIISDY
jgi:hypothetical protein